MICAEGLPTFYLSTKHRQDVIDAIRILYVNNAEIQSRLTTSDSFNLGFNLPVYSIPTKDLSKYAISKENASRGKYEYPEEKYLLDPQNEDYDKNERQHNSDSNEDVDDDSNTPQSRYDRDEAKDNKNSSKRFSRLVQSNKHLSKLYGTEFLKTTQKENKLENSELVYKQTENSKVSDSSKETNSLRSLGLSYISQSGGDDDEVDQDPDNIRQTAAFISEKKFTSLNNFILLKLLGEGAYGKVFLVKNTQDDNFYAMKRIRKDAIIEDRQMQFMKDKNNKKVAYLSEIFIMKEAENPFLVNLKYVFESEYRIYLIMDYFPGGDLFSQMEKYRRFNEEQTKFIAAQVAIAFGCLHKKNIIHRDLKPENLLVDEEGYCYLTDFGLSKVLNSPDDIAQTTCGTPDYTAPEVKRFQSYCNYSLIKH